VGMEQADHRISFNAEWQNNIYFIYLRGDKIIAGYRFELRIVHDLSCYPIYLVFL